MDRLTVDARVGFVDNQHVAVPACGGVRVGNGRSLLAGACGQQYGRIVEEAFPARMQASDEEVLMSFGAGSILPITVERAAILPPGGTPGLLEVGIAVAPLRVVPEPSSMILSTLCAAALLRRRRRDRYCGSFR